MSSQEQVNDGSILLREVLDSFLECLSKDQTIPAHVLAALKKHFADKTSISAQEVKVILTTSAEVS